MTNHTDSQNAPISTASNDSTVGASISFKVAVASLLKRRRFKDKPWFIPLVVCLVCLVIGSSIAGPILYQNYSAQYQRDRMLAQQGLHNLQLAGHRMQGILQNGALNEQTIVQARQEFGQAASQFTIVKQDLDGLPAFATLVPSVSAASHIVPIAVNIALVGSTACDMLKTAMPLFQDPLNTNTPKLSMQDAFLLKRDFTSLKAGINTIITQLNGLQPADLQLDARLGPMLKNFRSLLPALQTGLQDAQVLLDFSPLLLGLQQPTSYLIEQMDSTELRPGGGFIGTYGVLTLSGGKISNLNLTDTYLLDNAFTAAGQNIPYPPAYSWFTLAPTSWSLRDSNLDADFPTSARYAEDNFHREGGQPDVQGVIAITPALMQKALEITGPIYVDEYGETITAQNLIDRIHYYQLNVEWEGGSVPSSDGLSSVRKHFTAVLVKHFLDHVKELFPTKAAQFLQLAKKALYGKDIQIYFNNDQLEKLLQQNQLDASIQAPQGDSLFVVDANVISSKTNEFMNYTLQDNVTIDEEGNAQHQAVLTYAWPASQESRDNNYGSTIDTYLDYLRIYTPPSSELHGYEGLPTVTSGQASQRQFWGNNFSLDYGQSKSFTFSWTVPGAAWKDAQGWHYRYLLQRQAGVLWQVDTHIHLPGCASVTRQTVQTGSNNHKEFVYTQGLTHDTPLAVDYTCKS